MNRTITQIAQHYLTPAETQATRLDEALLNRIEAGIRCYDPCLSCSTHAAGFMPLQVRLFSNSGELLEERARA
jgi:NAD-reducing hydrogenase large subunit